MVAASHPNVWRFLSAIHRLHHTGGIEELIGNDASFPSVRTVYRWHEELGAGLTYYPAVAYEALGLVHLHLFIHEPRGSWERLVYAVRGAWMVRQPGAGLLYLHCLVPRCHEAILRLLLEEVSHLYSQITIIATGDGWQVMDGDATPAVHRARDDAWDIVKEYALLLPVVMESVEQRRSLLELWSVLSNRLGPRVWEYLPRFARRMPHNGKVYVRNALRLLNENLLFRQHVVRYAAIDDVTMEVLLRCRATPEQLHQLVGKDAPLVEFFPAGDEHLVRVSGMLPCLQKLFTAHDDLGVEDIMFADRLMNQQHPLGVRFAYEVLFDPRTCEWHFPRDEIIRRITS